MHQWRCDLPQHPIQLVLPCERTPFPSQALPFTVNKRDGVFSRIASLFFTAKAQRAQRKTRKNLLKSLHPLRLCGEISHLL